MAKSRSASRRQYGEVAAEVLAVVAALDRPLAYTTVATVATRLHAKGLLSRTRDGRGYAYTFRQDDAALRAVQMRRLLEAGSDRQQVLTHFLAELSA